MTNLKPIVALRISKDTTKIYLDEQAFALHFDNIEVFCATSISDGIELIEAMQHPVDIVVSDLIYEGKSTLDLYNYFQGHNQKPPIFIVTTNEKIKAMGIFKDKDDVNIIGRDTSILITKSEKALRFNHL